MNDISKSYYEIANEEYKKDPKPADEKAMSKAKTQTASENVPDDATATMQQLVAILAEQGIAPGTPEFDKWMQEALGQGDDLEDVAGEGKDDEAMEAEMAAQAAMMKQR